MNDLESDLPRGHGRAHPIHIGRQCRKGRRDALPRPDFADQGQQFGMRLGVVDAGHQQNGAHGRAGAFARHDFGRLHRPDLGRKKGQTERVAVTLAREMQQQRAGPVVPFPYVFRSRAAEAPPQDGVVEAEAREDLRHLRDVPEGVRRVTRVHDPAERLGDAMAESEIAHQSLPAHQEHVGHHVPGPDEQPPAANASSQALLLIGPDFEVVLEHDGLSIEMKEGELVVAIHPIEDRVDQVDEAQASVLAG